MFKFSVTTASENSLNITSLFGTNAGLNTDAIAFNYEVFLGGNSIGVFNQDNVAINDINDDFATASVVTGINPVISVPAAVEVDIYIKGQFNSLYFFDGGVKPNFAVEIKQWGRFNEINDWERFCKAHDSADIVISATDEPKFAQGVSLNRAFEDTTNNIFTAEALEAVNSWDTNKFGNGGRVFENGSDQPNFDMWSQNGAASSYALYA